MIARQECVLADLPSYPWIFGGEALVNNSWACKLIASGNRQFKQTWPKQKGLHLLEVTLRLVNAGMIANFQE